MATPGFKAEATLYNSSGLYREAASHLGPQPSTTAAVVPAAPIDWVKCGLAVAGTAAACSGPHAATGACALGGAVASAECAGPVSELVEWVGGFF